MPSIKATVFCVNPASFLAHPVIVFGSLAVMIYAMRQLQDKAPDPAKEKLAFVTSALYIVGAAFALYPVVLPASTDPARNLTIYNTAAGEHSLTVGLTWWILGALLACIIHQRWKVTEPLLEWSMRSGR